MPFCEASTLAGPSPSQRLQVIGTYMYSQCSATALGLASSLLGQKRKRDDPAVDHHNTKDSTIKSERTEPSRRLRKRARVSYMELTESDIESDADSGYNSDSSVEWSPHAKQTKVKRSHKATPEKPFPFLSLPSELRNKIYQLALEDPEGLVMNEGWRAYRRMPQRGQCFRHGNKEKYAGLANLVQPTTGQPLCATGSINSQGIDTPYPVESTVCTLSPSLLAVNKQIYAEAAAILYSQPLHFENTTALHSFLAPLSNQTASLVRSITIHTYENWGRGTRKAMNVSALTLLRSCSNLQKLCIEGYHTYEGYCNRGATTAQKRGQDQGVGIARQLYRDVGFWLDTVGASKALQILELPIFQRPDLRHYIHNRPLYDDLMEKIKHFEIAFAEELTHLIERTGEPRKRSKRSKTTHASD